MNGQSGCRGVLGCNRWDAEAIGALVRGQVVSALGDAGRVLVVDETGFIEKGEHPVGVAHQYPGKLAASRTTG